MTPQELAAIVFDFDGTIAETERGGHRVAYNEAFAELGLPWQWDAGEYGELLAVAGGKERVAAYIARERPEIEDARRAELVERIHATKRRRFERLSGGLELRPGVERFVREARAAGLRLGIATTAAGDGVAALLERHPVLARAFDTIVAGDDVAQKKPAPDAYELALARLECPARACLAVEDSAIGLAAARAAGIATLVTPSSYTAGEDFRGAAAVLTDLGEPGAPARALAGPPPAQGIVDVAFARELVRRFEATSGSRS